MVLSHDSRGVCTSQSDKYWCDIWTDMTTEWCCLVSSRGVCTSQSDKYWCDILTDRTTEWYCLMSSRGVCTSQSASISVTYGQTGLRNGTVS